jgi:CMP-N,N'-diacetyllegionaminic acid synthase
MTDKKILGIIPARGGSKSIPRKNIKPFCGKPLIAWSIQTLKESGVCDRVIVSTDDREIADVAAHFGAETPFIRPAELAEDTTPTLPVLQHAVSWLKEREGYNPDYVLLLEPPSVSKRPFHIREAAELLLKTGADSVVSVAEVPGTFSPYWQLKVGNENRIELFTGGTMKDVIRRRQDLPKSYYRNSAIYVLKTGCLFTSEPSLYGKDVRGYITDSKYAMDIDTPEDWVVAEALFKKILDEETKN